MGHGLPAQYETAQLTRGLIDHVEPPIWLAWVDPVLHDF